MDGEHVRNKEERIFRSGGLIPVFLLSVDCIEPDSGMNPAEAAEEAPSDPDTDAFYKTGRRAVAPRTPRTLLPAPRTPRTLLPAPRTLLPAPRTLLPAPS